MKVAAIQHDIVWEDRDATLRRLDPMIATAAAGGAELVVLSEMFAVGFTMSTGTVAEPPDGPTTRWMAGHSAKYGIWICGSVPERSPGTELPFNQLILAGPSGTVDRYAKMHPFSYSGEHEHYRAGADPLTVDINGVRTTFFICYDLRFADVFWEAASRTDLYVVPANWPSSRREHWRSLLAARAIENQAYVVGVNRVGKTKHLSYSGDTSVVDPMGNLITYASGTEAVLIAEALPEVVAETRETFPFMRDRRSKASANGSAVATSTGGAR